MARRKRKLTPDEKRAKALRNATFEIIFVNGKQKRVRRRHVDTAPPDDPIWLLENEMWPELHAYEQHQPELRNRPDAADDGDDEVPF